MNKLRAAALMVACIILVPSARAGGPASEPPDDLHQVLLNGGGIRPMFIPERVLQERSPEEVLTPWEAGIFRNHVATQRNPHLYMRFGRTNEPLCERIEEPATEGGTVELSRLHELINGVAMAFIAKVTGVTPGWSLTKTGVAELALLEVEDILDNHDERPLKVGDTLRVISSGGRLQFEEIVLCKESPTLMHRPAAGERVLVIGVPGESVPPGYFDDWMVFELRGGGVILQAEVASGATIRSAPLSQVIDGISPLQRDVQ